MPAKPSPSSPPTKTQSRKYRLKDNCGKHYQGDIRYNPGDIIETGNDLMKKFPNKFELVANELPASEGTVDKRHRLAGAAAKAGHRLS